MTDSDRFTTLLAACMQGMLCNPTLEFRDKNGPAPKAAEYAEEAMQIIDTRYPKEEDRCTTLRKQQGEFTRRVGSESGNSK